MITRLPQPETFYGRFPDQSSFSTVCLRPADFWYPGYRCVGGDNLVPRALALGTRLGWRMSFRIGLWDINLQNICPLEKGTNCCLVFSFFAFCAKYFFHRLTRPVKHINLRNKHKAFYSGNYRNNTAGSKTLQMAGLVEELSGLSSC